MNPGQSNAKKWALRAAKAVVAAAVVWFLVATLRDAWDELAAYQWRVDPLWLLAAGGFYLVGLLPSCLFWRRVLISLGQQPRWGETLRAYFIGHLGKYVPGKAMVVVLRCGMLRSGGVDRKVAAVSVFYETLTMMAVGAFLAAATLAVWFQEQTWMMLAALGLMVAALTPTVPPVFRRLVRLAGVGKGDGDTAARLQRLGYGSLAWGWLTIAIGWLLLALSLWATLRALGVSTTAGAPPAMAQMPLYTAAVSLAMVAGFLSLIPGGAGVRESILLVLLQTEFTQAQALVAAILLRLVWLVSELAISGILYLGTVKNNFRR